MTENDRFRDIHPRREIAYDLIKTPILFPEPPYGQAAFYFVSENDDRADYVAPVYDTLHCIHFYDQGENVGLPTVEYMVAWNYLSQKVERAITLYQHHQTLFGGHYFGLEVEAMGLLLRTYASDKLWRKRSLEDLQIQLGHLYGNTERLSKPDYFVPVEVREMEEKQEGEWLEFARTVIYKGRRLYYLRKPDQEGILQLVENKAEGEDENQNGAGLSTVEQEIRATLINSKALNPLSQVV